MAGMTADRWEADAATSAYLDSLAGPDEAELAELDRETMRKDWEWGVHQRVDAEPTTTDDLTIEDGLEEWRDNSCE